MKISVSPSGATLAVRWFRWVTIVGAGVAMVEPFARPHTIQLPDIQPGHAVSVAESTGVVSVRMEDLSGIWSRHLREILIEPKAATPPPTKTEPPPLQVVLPKLVATFVEGGQSSVLITDEAGKLRIRATGESIGTFQVHQIRPGRAVLQRGDQSYELQVPTSARGLPNSKGGGSRLP